MSASGTKSRMSGVRLSVRLPSRGVPICVSEPTGRPRPLREKKRARDEGRANSTHTRQEHAELAFGGFELWLRHDRRGSVSALDVDPNPPHARRDSCGGPRQPLGGWAPRAETVAGGRGRATDRPHHQGAGTRRACNRSASLLATSATSWRQALPSTSSSPSSRSSRTTSTKSPTGPRSSRRVHSSSAPHCY